MKLNYKPSRNNFAAMFAAILIGYMIAYQFNLQKRISAIQGSKQDEDLATEVAYLLTANDQLSKQLDDLSLQKEKLSSESTSSSNDLQALESDIVNYRILLGKSAVHGPGVIITIKSDLLLPQIVDLMDALRNIGFDALAINDKRITPKTGFMDGFKAPTVIKVIGDPTLLNDGLDRRGGILEQTGIDASIQKSDNVTVPAQ